MCYWPINQNKILMNIDYNIRWEIIKKFSAKNNSCFRNMDVIAEFPNKGRSHLSKVLASMVSMGMLMKICRDLYYIIPLNADPETYSPDSRLVAKCLMKGQGYYLGYTSAMSILGLSDQEGDKTMVVTDRQRQPSIITMKGTEYQFINHSYDRFFGYRETWISNHEQALVSDLEKTIVDSLSKPHLCGGIIEIGKAIYLSKERTNLKKLFYYLARNGSHAAKKRYIFLSDILGLDWTSEHERMLRYSGASFSLLDPTVPDQGVKNSRFGLKINRAQLTLKDFLRSR